MRPGLVIVGALGIALGIGLALIGGVFNYPTSSTNDTVRVQAFSVPAHSNYTLIFPLSSGTLSFSDNFTSSLPVSATLWACSLDIPACLLGSVMNQTRGAWTIENPPSQLFLSIEDGTSESSAIEVTTHVAMHTTSGFAWWETFLVLGSSAILMGGGGVAVFLGLFLGANPYGRPPPPEEPVLAEAPQAGDPEEPPSTKSD